MKSPKSLGLGGAMMLLILLANCSGDDPANPPADGGFNAVVSTGGEFEIVTPKNEVVADPTVTETVGNESFFCTTTHYDIVDAPNDFVLLNPNAGVLWPGNLLQGATLNTNTPSNIYARRGPGTVTMTILNGSRNVTRQLPETSLGAVQQAMNDIISTASDTLAANFQFTYEEVQSWQQLALSLQASVSYCSANVSTSLGFSTDRQYSRYIVKLNQRFFDMVFDPPSKVADFFHPEVTPEDLEPYIGPGNPPAFVRQVSYGRIFYLLIESTSTRTEMEASLSASFSAAVASGSMNADAEYITALDNVKIKCFALGGSQEAAFNAITTDFESLKNFLAEGGQIRTGVPVSYVACALAPPHNVVNVAVAANYDVTHCVPVGESFENPIFWYQASEDDPVNDPVQVERDANDHVVAWNNRLFYDNDDKDAIPMDGYEAAGSYVAAAANARAAVSFGAPTADVGGSLGYSGADFQGSSFTVVAVVRMLNTTASFPAYFMFGNSGVDRRNLQIGFRDDARVTMTTGNQVINADVGHPVTNFNVLTFVYSSDHGMSIYVNLDTGAAATDVALTQSLLGYTGARIGSHNGAQFQIGEIKAYGIAFHDAQREFVVERLMEKYGI